MAGPRGGEIIGDRGRVTIAVAEADPGALGAGRWGAGSGTGTAAVAAAEPAAHPHTRAKPFLQHGTCKCPSLEARPGGLAAGVAGCFRCRWSCHPHGTGRGARGRGCSRLPRLGSRCKCGRPGRRRWRGGNAGAPGSLDGPGLANGPFGLGDAGGAAGSGGLEGVGGNEGCQHLHLLAFLVAPPRSACGLGKSRPRSRVF